MVRIVFLLYILFPVSCLSQMERFDAKVSFAIETYAFLKGQNAALQKVAVQFPQLRSNVTAAQQSLKTVYGRAENNIKQFLKEELDNSQLNLLHIQIDSLLNQQLLNPIEKEKNAHDFLLKIKERFHFIDNISVSKGVLSFKYHDAPHQEIADGHVDFFTTENHPKAEKASLKVPIPKSWLAEEAEIPQTIQQFTSYYGNGNEKILIVVYDLPQEMHNFKLNEKSVSSLLPPQSNLIRTEPVIIDDIPAFMVEVEELLENKEPMKIRMLQFMFIQDEKLYCLQGSIGPADKGEDLGLRIKKYEPLFRLIASKTELE